MGTALEKEDIVEVLSVLGVKIRTTKKYWGHIVQHKHGELAGRLQDTLNALTQPDEVYRQDETSDIYLYYQQHNDFTICVVARHLNGDGFVMTAYLTTKNKRKGILVWKKNTMTTTE